MAELALCGGQALRTRSFPSWPVFDDQETAAVLEVLESGKWGHVMSPDDKATAFEREFAAYHGVKYAIAVASGSVALEAALRTAGIGFGDEVITPRRPGWRQIWRRSWLERIRSLWISSLRPIASIPGRLSWPSPP